MLEGHSVKIVAKKMFNDNMLCKQSLIYIQMSRTIYTAQWIRAWLSF